MPDNQSPKPPVVFVHGLWLHAESWHNWIEFFRASGYNAMAVSWPGDGATTVATRQMPEALAGYGVTEIADHIAGQLRELPQKPILIGHSLTIDIGWKELADYSLSWLQGKGL